MILADKITEERKKNGWSQEELANQLGVSRQAVSKWESAGAVPDLQRILQMSELFCVSTDYLLKDEMKAENITYHESTESYAEPLKKVTMENANEFLDMKRNGSKVVANATSMCISNIESFLLYRHISKTGHKFHILLGLRQPFKKRNTGFFFFRCRFYRTNTGTPLHDHRFSPGKYGTWHGNNLYFFRCVIRISNFVRII